MSTAAPLEVVLTLPPAPYALTTAGFMATLAAVEQEIEATPAITTPEAAQAAANIQARLTTAGTALETSRKKLKQPFIDAGRAIDAAANEPAARIEAAKSKVKRLLTVFDENERIKAANAERERQRKLRELEEQARKEREDADRKAKEIADQLAAQAAALPPDIEIMEMGDDSPPEPPQKTETEKQIEAIQHAPAVVAAKPVGVVMRVTLVATVTDVNALPDVFVERVAKLAAIKSTFCNGWSEGKAMPVCAGVRFDIKREPISTGR